MQVGQNTIESIVDSLGALVNEHRVALNDAFLKSEDELSVSLSIKLCPENGRMKIESSINFVAERVKDKTTTFVSEAQGKLFEG